MSYTLLDLQKDNDFAALQSKAIKNLIRLINSTGSDFKLLINFSQNWVRYINDNPDSDPSGNLLNVLTNDYSNGLLDCITADFGKQDAIRLFNSDELYNFQYIDYITGLTTHDSSYTTIVEFLNQLIAL